MRPKAREHRRRIPCCGTRGHRNQQNYNSNRNDRWERGHDKILRRTSPAATALRPGFLGLLKCVGTLFNSLLNLFFRRLNKSLRMAAQVFSSVPESINTIAD